MPSDRLACRDLREGLTEYLDDALPPPTRQGFETHLSSCAGCRRFLGQIRATVAATPHLPREAMPSDLKTSLLHSLRDQRPR